MKLSGICSQLCVTEFGTGFLDVRTRELRKAFGVHVAPEPQNVRPATEQEAREFFRDRATINQELCAWYATPGRYSGD